LTAGGFTVPTRPIRGLDRNRAQDRDRGAEVSALVERETGSLLNYFLRRTVTAEDAADLLGETFLVIWRRERSMPADVTQARMWMFGIAKKVLSGQRRSSTR
jgi:RNA polymerase sigma-70 factor (ECF subfamily)